MNNDQLMSILRQLLAAGGPVAALLVNWGVPAGQVNSYLTIALAVLPPLGAAIWGALKHTDHATVAAAGNMPGVTVSVDPAKAGAGAQAAAADPSLPSVEVKK